MNQLSTRLARLLNMVPYLKTRPGITKVQAAAELGVTPKQLHADLVQLAMCGLPGYGPGDLIDVTFYDDRLDVHEDAGVTRPLRLRSREAAALLMALRALAEMPGIVDPRAALSAIAKIENAAGTAAHPVPASTGTENATAEVVRDAVHRQRALAIDYYAASRDSMSHRVVDPIRVVLISAHTYLEGGAANPKAFACSGSTASTPHSCSTSRHRRPRRPAGRNRHLPVRCRSVVADRDRAGRAERGMDVRVLPDATAPRAARRGYEAEMTYASDEWLTRLLLGMGDEVQIVEPTSLAAGLRDAAAAALAAYRAQ